MQKKAVGPEITLEFNNGQKFDTLQSILVVDKIKKYKDRRNPYSNLLPIDKELLE